MANPKPAMLVPRPALRVLKPTEYPSFTAPSKRINEGTDVARFLTSLAYRDIGLFILQLNHAVCPRNQPGNTPRMFILSSKPSSIPSILSLQTLLSKTEGLVDEAPPDPGPRRFGNVSFRKWFALLEERVDEMLGQDRLGETLHGEAKEEVKRYLLGAFGSSPRLDYGTGHELSFMAFLGCLWKLGHFQDDQEGIEREIVLNVVERYLQVIRKLILTYTLEPAGSHGVWGLDDHSFMPYIFGSAQFTRPIDDADPMPLEGSVRGAPKPASITKADVVEDYRQTNMYFSAVGFINDVKKGPFWEHSPILFDISGIRDGWGKINKGMIKMFDAEVLSKFPVVQHFPFGSLFAWEQDPEAGVPTQSVHMVNQPVLDSAPGGTAGTAAPWARGASAPTGIPSRTPPSGATRRGTNQGQMKAPWA